MLCISRLIVTLVLKNIIYILNNLALKTIKRMLEEGKDVAVYCFCEDVSKCHRSIIGDLFEKKGFEVIR